ncbi:MAG: ATP-binding protein, partial [Planctomycetota bacterium]
SLTVMWDVSAVRDGDGTPTHFAATLRDLRDQRALEARVLNAQTREQARIARDLHDGVAQQLAGLDMLCGLLTAQAADGEDVTETVEHIAGAVRGAARHRRGGAPGLMPRDEDRVGLTKGLKRLAKLTTEIGTARCAFETPDGPVLVADFSVAHHLYRIAQEALGNAIRHGGAANVTITLATRDADLAELIVDDDGTGFDPAAEEADARSDDARLRRDYGDDEEGEQGMGLSAMRFRARSIHGRLRFERRDSGGMRVACTFPHVRDATPQDA